MGHGKLEIEGRSLGVGLSQGAQYFFEVARGGRRAQGEALNLKIEEPGPNFVPAHGRDVAAKLAQPAQGDFRGAIREVEGASEDGIMERDPRGQIGTEGSLGFGTARDWILGELEGGPAGKPVPVAVLAPLREVLFADRVPAELGVGERLDLGKGVEPGDEAVAFFTLAQALVELVADLTGQAGDFSDAFRSHIFSV
jgi:hypothetical protein